MPLSTNPNARAHWSLDIDLETPRPQRAAFLVKFMTVDEHNAWRAAMDEAKSAVDGAGSYAALRKAIAVGIVGWENLNYPPAHAEAGKPIPFDLDLLLGSGVLTEQEAWQIGWRYPEAVRPVAVDLKNSGSPQPSAAAPSVPVASPAV